MSLTRPSDGREVWKIWLERDKNSTAVHPSRAPVERQRKQTPMRLITSPPVPAEHLSRLPRDAILSSSNLHLLLLFLSLVRFYSLLQHVVRPVAIFSPISSSRTYTQTHIVKSYALCRCTIRYNIIIPRGQANTKIHYTPRVIRLTTSIKQKSYCLFTFPNYFILSQFYFIILVILISSQLCGGLGRSIVVYPNIYVKHMIRTEL